MVLVNESDEGSITEMFKISYWILVDGDSEEFLELSQVSFNLSPTVCGPLPSIVVSSIPFVEFDGSPSGEIANFDLDWIGFVEDSWWSGWYIVK